MNLRFRATICWASLSIGWCPSVAQSPYVSASEISDALAHPINGLAVQRLPTDEHSTILVARRNGDGEVEIQRRFGDEILIRAGRAVITVGARAVGSRPTGRGEFRGGEILDGRDFAVSSGDALWIPAGTPHRIRVGTGESVTYVTFKIPK